MSYTHFSIIERSQLEILYRMEWINREIGEKLGRHHSAIAREKKRGSKNGVYKVEVAHAANLVTRANCRA